jgi:hypothetical protein
MQFPCLQLPDTEAAFVQEGIHNTFHLVHASAAARTPAEASLSARRQTQDRTRTGGELLFSIGGGARHANADYSHLRSLYRRSDICRGAIHDCAAIS